MGSITHDAVIQHWIGKAQSLSKGKWLKRAPAAARKRDRSTLGFSISFSSSTIGYLASSYETLSRHGAQRPVEYTSACASLLYPRAFFVRRWKIPTPTIADLAATAITPAWPNAILAAHLFRN